MSSDACWYVYINGKTFGPIGFDDLATLARRGQLRKTDLVWAEGYSSWVPAGSIDSLLLPRDGGAQFPPAIPDSINDRPPLRPATNYAEGAIKSTTGFSRRGSRNYFLRHWRGELSLPVSYWINGFLGNLFAAVTIAVIDANTNLKTDFAPIIALLSIILTWATLCLISAWQVVGTWRSANHYKKANPTKYWGGIAQFILILAVLRTVGAFFGTGVPQIAELYAIYGGDERTGKHAFRMLRDGQELELAGGITFGTAKEFERFVDAMGALEVVHLNSQGGRILEAQRIADIIKSRNLITYVSGECLSACTIIFLSGRERYIAETGRLGFHQPDFPGLTAEDRRAIIAEEETRLRRLGVSEAFARKAVQAKPDDMWFPPPGELIKEGVVTRVVQSASFALSGITTSSITPQHVQKILLSNETYVAIKRINPEAYGEISTKFEKGLRRGSSIAELHEQISPITNAVLLEALPYASQQSLLEFARFAVKAATLFNMKSPSSCYFYFNPDKTDSKTILGIRATFKSVFEEEAALMTKILQSVERETVQVPSDREVAPALDRILVILAARYGDQLDILSEDIIPPNKYSAYCSILTSIYEEALKLPPRESTAFLRHMFSSQTRDPKRKDAAVVNR